MQGRFEPTARLALQPSHGLLGFLLCLDQHILHRAVLLDRDALLQEQFIEALCAAIVLGDRVLQLVALSLNGGGIAVGLLAELCAQTLSQHGADARESQGLTSLLHELLLAEVRLRARPTLLGTAVVPVALLDLARNTAPALATLERVSPWELLEDGLLPLAAIQFDLSAAVEKLLRDQCLVFAVVELAVVPEHSVVERIRESMFDLGNGQFPLADTHIALADQAITNLFHAVVARGIQLEHLTDQGCPRGIDAKCPGRSVVDIAHRSR